MTRYALLLKLSGLSQSEAALLHQVRLDTVKSWSNGRRTAPPGSVDDLVQLIKTQQKSADAALAVYRKQTAEHGRPDVIDLSASILGQWPQGGGSMALARFLAGLPADQAVNLE